MHQLLRMMQAMSISDGYMETAQTLIVKVGLFFNYQLFPSFRQLSIGLVLGLALLMTKEERL